MDNIDTKKKKVHQILSGTVVSSRNHCTIVAIERIFKHPKYGKYLHRRKKIKAHDYSDSREVGSKVDIIACRPVSKEKRFKVVELKDENPKL